MSQRTAAAEPGEAVSPPTPPPPLPEDRELSREFVAETNLLSDAGDGREEEFPLEPRRKRTWLMGILVFLLVVLLLGGAAFYIYPPAGQAVVKQLVEIFPPLGDLLSPGSKIPAVGPAQVKIIDLKQRFVDNAMGRIRVVEGMAVNASSESMTRIKVQAELYDVLNVPVRQSVSYCGNLLTDQELKVTPEEQILRKLAIPQGTDISNDRVPPKGMIPFMLVFFGEPPGVVKTLVMPVGAERILP